MEDKLKQALVWVLEERTSDSGKGPDRVDLELLHGLVLAHHREVLNEAIVGGFKGGESTLWDDLKQRLEKVLPEETVQKLSGVTPVKYPMGCLPVKPKSSQD